MNCPFCGSTQIAVVNSRPTKGSSQVWRRRKCQSCGGVYTTYEKVELSHLIVIKESGRKQKYSRAKLFSGIYHATIDKKSADRGEMSQLAEEVTNLVEKEIIDLKSKEISASAIKKIVLTNLKKKSPDALLRFIAYKDGNDKKKMGNIVRKYF